jgi:hypothetical protein
MLAVGIALSCLGILLTAAWLTPNPKGIGTHHRLGLTTCQMLVRTGLPCPSCGMTTSFAWFARGNLPASLYVQPAGLMLAILTTMLFWASLYIAVTGRAAHRLLQVIHPQVYLFALFGVGIVGWIWKIFIHVRGIDGWN